MAPQTGTEVPHIFRVKTEYEKNTVFNVHAIKEILVFRSNFFVTGIILFIIISLDVTQRYLVILYPLTQANEINTSRMNSQSIRGLNLNIFSFSETENK